MKNYLLDNIIKLGYLESVTIDENVELDVSEASYRHPIDPDDYEDPHDFEIRLAEDVNNLVTVANTYKCRGTCYKYRKNTYECRFGYPREIVPHTVKN